MLRWALIGNKKGKFVQTMWYMIVCACVHVCVCAHVCMHPCVHIAVRGGMVVVIILNGLMWLLLFSEELDLVLLCLRHPLSICHECRQERCVNIQLFTFKNKILQQVSSLENQDIALRMKFLNFFVSFVNVHAN